MENSLWMTSFFSFSTNFFFSFYFFPHFSYCHGERSIESYCPHIWFCGHIHMWAREKYKEAETLTGVEEFFIVSFSHSFSFLPPPLTYLTANKCDPTIVHNSFKNSYLILGKISLQIKVTLFIRNRY